MNSIQNFLSFLSAACRFITGKTISFIPLNQHMDKINTRKTIRLIQYIHKLFSRKFKKPCPGINTGQMDEYTFNNASGFMNYPNLSHFRFTTSFSPIGSYPCFSSHFPRITDEHTTRGIDTPSLIRVNLIPMNEASKSVMGIRQIAAAPI